MYFSERKLYERKLYRKPKQTFSAQYTFFPQILHVWSTQTKEKEDPGFLMPCVSIYFRTYIPRNQKYYPEHVRKSPKSLLLNNNLTNSDLRSSGILRGVVWYLLKTGQIRFPETSVNTTRRRVIPQKSADLIKKAVEGWNQTKRSSLPLDVTGPPVCLINTQVLLQYLL